VADARGNRRLWCEAAWLPAGVARGVAIEISGGVISGIRTEVPREAAADAEVVRGLTLPGFANAHSHAFHRALRGRVQRGSGDFFTWRENMYEVAARLSPALYLPLARATFAEMLLAGYTVVGEFHYLHHKVDGAPYPDPNAMGAAIIQAAREAGIRLTLLDTCYLRGGAGIALSDRQRRFGDGDVARWKARVARLVADDTTRIGAAIHSVRAVDAPSIEEIAAWATERGMVLHAHVSEQPAENQQTLAESGCTPMALLDRRGALSPRFTAVHGTHLDAADIALCAAAGAICCFCPTTERDLGDGIGPSKSLSDRGVRLAIGSDQHAVIDPFEELRAIELHERLRSQQRGTHTAATLMKAGTAHGYTSVGWPEGGVIAVGALADLTTVALGGVRLAGTIDGQGWLEAIVFAAGAGDVDMVIVGGETVVRGGRHVTFDVAGELERAIADVYTAGGPQAACTSGR
jgi:formiminoglutamate deiminase